MAKTDRNTKHARSARDEPRMARQVANLALLGGRAIRLLAAKHLREHALGSDIDILRWQLAYRLQADAYGELKPAIRHRLRRIYRHMQLDPAYAPKPHYALAVGTVLEREWRGVTHQVAVTDDGFEYKSMRFSTLSEIARQIAGTRWSGPLFFGLRKGARK